MTVRVGAGLQPQNPSNYAYELSCLREQFEGRYIIFQTPSPWAPPITVTVNPQPKATEVMINVTWNRCEICLR